MNRIVVYYSLSGNTEEAAKTIAEKLGADILRVDTVKAMPKNYMAQILVGGGQVAMKKIPEIKPLEKDMSTYDEIILGTPIWNSKGVPAINAFLKDAEAAKKVTSVFTLCGGGEIDKCLNALKLLLPNFKRSVSLLDKKRPGASENKAKIDKFVEEILKG